MSKKMGRPRVSKSEFRGVLIGARFSPEEAKQVKIAVRQSGINKSRWVRNCLLAAARSAMG
jgi:hypothetical protein